MPDTIPPQIWLLISLAALAIVPACQVAREVRRRNVSPTPEDRLRRNSAQLARSLGVLALLATLAAFIWTPTADHLFRSPRGLMITLALFAAYPLYTVWQGLTYGRMEPLGQGRVREYSSARQPKRFWTSIVWNGALGSLFLSLLVVEVRLHLKGDCLRVDDEITAEAALPGCNALVADATTLADRAEAHAARGHAHHLLGHRRQAAADHAAAITDLTALLRDFPDDEWTLRQRGQVYWEMGQHDLARDDDDRVALCHGRGGAPWITDRHLQPPCPT
ncbi:hypothetical protein V5740_13890 (plasmid) [Croceibacterium sp. TMG7-5b_MA50]|uniref:hypothetical protein n=1 Tax=Croceibacterium sp. TMG7-5b_MA50 TaxID=3121290 RepID=UPI0032219738